MTEPSCRPYPPAALEATRSVTGMARDVERDRPYGTECRHGRHLCPECDAERIAKSRQADIERRAEEALARAGKTLQRWRDIRTAPRDGTRVLLYVAGKDGLPPFLCDAAYYPDGGWRVDEIREATHWMPLPVPPEEP